MLILLPPSETKRQGGVEGSRLEASRLSFSSLAAVREQVIDVLELLASDVDASLSALKLSPKQAPEVERNRVIRSAPVLPAIDRYDGVLFDALDAPSLDEPARAFAHEHVAIASAAFGLTRALDPIPAYRLSAGSRLPGVRMAQLWSTIVAREIAQHTGLILDLRSEAYAALGPIPSRGDAVFVRVVSDDGGRRRALNHFNKAGKGRLVRALVTAGQVHPDVASLSEWAAHAGIRLEPGAAGEVDLVV